MTLLQKNYKFGDKQLQSPSGIFFWPLDEDLHPMTGDTRLALGGQVYAGTNRTYIDAVTGVMKTAGANEPRFEYVGGGKGLLLEPAAANILLEVLTDWTDTTLTPVKNATSWAGAANGAYTVTASGANGTLISTAVSATSAAFTFVCAIKRKTGTGAVSMTIDNGSTWTEKTLTTSFQYFNVTKTAANPQLGFKLATSGDAIIVDCLMLVPNTALASSYFAPAAAIGAELVTDGGFAAVTQGADIASGWNLTSWPGSNAVVDDANTFHVTAAGGTIWVDLVPPLVAGNCYKVVIAGSVNVGTWGFYSNAFITSTNGTFYFNHAAGGGADLQFVLSDINAIFDLTTFEIYPITFTSWTAGAGWAPQATAGSLTGKAQKIAGTASYLEQDLVSTELRHVYRELVTATRTAGSLFVYHAKGAVGYDTITANGSYVFYPLWAHTGTNDTVLGFYADATFAGTVDDVSVMEHGTVRLSEANTTTLAMVGIPKVTAMLAAGTGTIVIKGRFAFARAVGVVTAILSSQDATASLAYTTTAAGNLTTYDGTTIAESTGAYTANVDWKIAITFPSDTNKYRIGVDADGAGIVQGTEVAFDGNFTTTANLILGRVLHGATWIKYIKMFDEVLTDIQINSMS